MESYVERKTYNESYNKYYLLNNIISEKNHIKFDQIQVA